MQVHGLAAFPASVQLPKLAVDSFRAHLPEQVVVPVSPQPPRLTVVSESTQLHKPVGVPVHAQMSELAIDWVPMQIPDLTYMYAPVSA